MEELEHGECPLEGDSSSWKDDKEISPDIFYRKKKAGRDHSSAVVQPLLTCKGFIHYWHLKDYQGIVLEKKSWVKDSNSCIIPYQHNNILILYLCSVALLLHKNTFPGVNYIINQGQPREYDKFVVSCLYFYLFSIRAFVLGGRIYLFLTIPLSWQKYQSFPLHAHKNYYRNSYCFS